VIADGYSFSGDGEERIVFHVEGEEWEIYSKSISF